MSTKDREEMYEVVAESVERGFLRQIFRGRYVRATVKINPRGPQAGSVRNPVTAFSVYSEKQHRGLMRAQLTALLEKHEKKAKEETLLKGEISNETTQDIARIKYNLEILDDTD